MLLFVALQNQIPTGGSSERAGTNKDQPSNCLLTAAKLSDYLDLTPRAVRKRLGSGVADGPAGGGGRSAMGWRWEVLPVDWQKQLEDISERKGFRSPQSMLAESQGSGWLPPVSFDRLPDRFKDEAMKWRDALLPVLRGQEGGVLGVDGAARGMEECRRVFGRSVSESTWRRHFDLAVERDANFEHWGRLDLYVAAEAFGHVSEGGGARGDRGDVGFLTDTISQIATPSHLTPEDRDAVFGALVNRGETRATDLDYIFGALPGLSRTRKGLGKWYKRKLRELRTKGNELDAVKDGRPGRSGRKGARLCPECERIVAGAAVDLDGDLAQAWRRLLLKAEICTKCAGLWHFNVRENKSYVPKAVRDQVMPGVLSALPFRHGIKFARLNAPYVLRNPDDTGPGDVFEADDMTPNHIFTVYGWDTDESGLPFVGRCEFLLMMDRRTLYPVGYLLKSGDVGPDGKQRAASYSGFDIRKLVLHVHDNVGLSGALLFECGIWKSRLVVGRKDRGWEPSLWRDYERGLNEEGIFMGPRPDAVRHAMPSLPRTKVIERVFRSVQERMRPLPGFVGFNHREYKPEVLNDFLRRVRDGKENPAEMFLGMKEIRDLIDVELMGYATEPQNGRWLPGVSPQEAWLNGIGGYPGLKQKPLRQLPATARHLLSTHRRKVQVGPDGIRFEVGGKLLVFWGDELGPYRNKVIPVRWNIDEPELLHCLPPGAAVFTMKLRELPSWTASREDLAEAGKARNRWINRGKVLFDKLPHKLVGTVIRDEEHRAEVHEVGAAVQTATNEHRDMKVTEEKERGEMHLAARKLGLGVGKNDTVSPEDMAMAIAAQKRREERAKLEMETTHDQN